MFFASVRRPDDRGDRRRRTVTSSARCCRWGSSDSRLEPRVPDGKPPALEDAGDCTRSSEDREIDRLVIEQNRIEHVPGSDAPQMIGDSEKLRTVPRSCEQRLLDGQSGLVKKRNLREVVSVQLAADEVATERDFHPMCVRD